MDLDINKFMRKLYINLYDKEHKRVLTYDEYDYVAKLIKSFKRLRIWRG